MLSTTQLESPLGPLFAAATGAGLCYLSFGEQPEEALADLKRRHPGSEPSPDPARFQALAAQLAEYFAGRRKSFDLPLDPAGTPFQRKVWQALQRIPYGETRSYKQLAELVDSPKAFRAVGMANRCNPIALIVPCHRVIGADGSLTGYAGGLDLKRRLLEHERKALQPSLF